jgi:hypothetical protein
MFPNISMYNSTPDGIFDRKLGNRIKTLSPKAEDLDLMLQTPNSSLAAEKLLGSTPENTKNNKKRFKGLEEIGIFSDLTCSKIITNKEINKPSRNHIIHVTDFMKNNQKNKIIKLAGAMQEYDCRKAKYKRDLMNQKVFLQKIASFYRTPQVSPRFEYNGETLKYYSPSNSHSNSIKK